MFGLTHDQIDVVLIMLAYLAGAATIMAAIGSYILLSEYSKDSEARYDLKPHRMEVHADRDKIAEAVNVIA